MADPSILIVESDEHAVQTLTRDLRSQGYRCLLATNGSDALEMLDLRHPDIVLLSFDLADRSGTDLCRRFRSRVSNPIIAFSSDARETSKVLALDAGADDYLVVPLSMPELFARLRVALRHRRALASLIDDLSFEVGDLKIVVHEHVAVIGPNLLVLTPKEFELLVLLARNVGKVVAHQTILETIWSPAQSPDTLRLHVSQLRKKLGEGKGTPRLVTKSGVGYALSAPDATPGQYLSAGSSRSTHPGTVHGR